MHQRDPDSSNVLIPSCMEEGLSYEVQVLILHSSLENHVSVTSEVAPFLAAGNRSGKDAV